MPIKKLRRLLCGKAADCQEKEKRGAAPAFFLTALFFFLFLPFGTALPLFLFGLLFLACLICPFILGYRERLSLRPRHFFGAAVSLLLMAGCLAGTHSAHPDSIFDAASLALVYLCALFLAVAAVTAYYSSHPPDIHVHCIVILGCALHGKELTPILKARTDCAIQYYRRQTGRGECAPLLIPSGGQGPDEQMAEAEAIRRYLRKQGIPDAHILTETRSRNTRQNMEYAFGLAVESIPSPICIFATTSYHLFRSMLWARRAGMGGMGIGSRTRWYYWPGAFVREFIGILYAALPIHCTVLILLFLYCLL